MQSMWLTSNPAFKCKACHSRIHFTNLERKLFCKTCFSYKDAGECYTYKDGYRSGKRKPLNAEKERKGMTVSTLRRAKRKRNGLVKRGLCTRCGRNKHRKDRSMCRKCLDRNKKYKKQ